MKLRTLEIKLEGLRGFENPDITLEQYSTPAETAARVVYEAYVKGDIEDLKILDIGCGTGILSIASKLMGAEYVKGIDISAGALKTAAENAALVHEDIDFEECSVEEFAARAKDADDKDAFDTVIMNPPFGAQNSNVHADRAFIDAALSAAPVVYGIFNSGTLNFLKSYLKDRAEVTDAYRCEYPMKKTFAHQTRECVDISVEVIRFERKD